MSQAADWLEAEATKWAFTTEAVTRPTTWFVALHTANPSDAGSSNEVVATWYARQAVAWTRTLGSVANTAAITFPAVTGSASTITHMTITDAATSGNVLAIITMAAPVTAQVGDQFQIASGTLTVSVA